MENITAKKNRLRTRRHIRIRARISGTALRPRLVVNRSNRFISAQLIDDEAGKTLASAHGREFKGSQSAQAKEVGKAIAERGKKAGTSAVVFDRAGYRYGGQVKTLAESARENGLTF